MLRRLARLSGERTLDDCPARNAGHFHAQLPATITQTSRGTVVVTDFMPIRGHNSDLVRFVRCTNGTVDMNMELCPRFEYGKAVAWVESEV
jgi:hypothetical protein